MFLTFRVESKGNTTSPNLQASYCSCSSHLLISSYKRDMVLLQSPCRQSQIIRIFQIELDFQCTSKFANRVLLPLDCVLCYHAIILSCCYSVMLMLLCSVKQESAGFQRTAEYSAACKSTLVLGGDCN